MTKSTSSLSPKVQGLSYDLAGGARPARLVSGCRGGGLGELCAGTLLCHHLGGRQWDCLVVRAVVSAHQGLTFQPVPGPGGGAG